MVTTPISGEFVASSASLNLVRFDYLLFVVNGSSSPESGSLELLFRFLNDVWDLTDLTSSLISATSSIESFN